MSDLGVHSEVGRLRKVMVHRPGLELQRLTPSNHDDLLFDDVLWVERAQWEHDQFVARMRERGVEVFLLTEWRRRARSQRVRRLRFDRLEIALLRTIEQPLDDASVGLRAHTNQAILAAVESFDLELLTGLDPIALSKFSG